MPVLRVTRLALSSLLCLGALSAALAANADPFVDQVAVLNAIEIQAGQQALEKATFDDTRTLARRLVDDHTALAQQLAVLAGQLQIAPTPPTVPQPKVNNTPAGAGASFDGTYAKAQVEAHEAAVKLFDHEAQSATTPQLKAFAQQNLAMMQHHLQMARRLLKTHHK